eukprot:jgi/Picsp_1/6471/NSC_03817-R1_chaperone protein
MYSTLGKIPAERAKIVFASSEKRVVRFAPLTLRHPVADVQRTIVPHILGELIFMYKNYSRIGISQNAGGSSIGSHDRVRVPSRLTRRSHGAGNVISAVRRQGFVRTERNGLFCDQKQQKERDGVPRGERGERGYTESGRRVDKGYQYKDPWDLLGVDPAASEEDIKKAHRKLVLKLHPDRHGGDKKIERKFIAVQEAYEMLLGRRMSSTAMERTGVSQGGWKFHDWFWSFSYLRRKKKMEKGNGEAKMPPPPAGHWRQQMVDLKKRAVARKMRRNQKNGFVVHDERMQRETNISENHVNSGSENAVEHDGAVQQDGGNSSTVNEEVKRKWNVRSLFETYKEGHMQHTQAMENMSARMSHVSSHIATFRERLSSVGNRTISASDDNTFDDKVCSEDHVFRSENCNSNKHKGIDLSSPESGTGEEETNRNERNDEQDSRPGHVAKQLAGLRRKAALKQELLD